MKLRSLAITALLIGGAASAQNQYDATFSVIKTTTLSSSAEVLTLFHPSTYNRNAKLVGIYFYSAAACTVALERGGTPSAGTTATIVNDNPSNPLVQTTSITATSGTTVTSTTTVNTFNLTAGGWNWLDGNPYQLPSSTADSITLRTSSCSGVVNLMFQWREL